MRKKGKEGGEARRATRDGKEKRMIEGKKEEVRVHRK